MSYSMSPPAQKPTPGLYAQYPNAAGSPTNQTPYGPRPAKRQRTSPNPLSPPNGATSWAYPAHGLPNGGGYGPPYAGATSAIQSPYANSPSYGQSPQHSSFNTPQPYPYQQSPWQSQAPTPAPSRQMSPPSQQSRDAMPPPPKPKPQDREEKVGVEDIGDSLFGSGINLKDEEHYMHTVYNNQHQAYNAQSSQSFSSNHNTSFGSTTGGNNSFGALTQGTSFGSQEALGGTLRAARTEEDVELEQRRKRERAARDQAERRQHHLNNQFLQCNNVRKRMDVLARNQGVMLNVTGLWVKQPEQEPLTSVRMNGAGNEGLVAVKEDTKRPESFIAQHTPFEQIVGLVSLAAGERVRGLIDEAYALTRARRYGDQGRVPPDFADIAVGEGKSNEVTVVPENITGSQWDQVPGQDPAVPDGADGVEVVAAPAPTSKSSTPQPQSTIAFQGTLNAQLRSLAEKDRAAQKEREKKREARKRKASEMESTSEGTPADAAAPETAAAPVEAPSKLTKKEQIRQQKEKNSSTEAQLHHSTNQTAAMMAMGKKTSKYSWMTGGASSLPTNRFAKPSTSANASGAATPIKPESGSTAVTPGGVATAMAKTSSAQGRDLDKELEWGAFRETGKGIEMRDWVLVLERDGREKAALMKMLHRQKQTE